MKTVQCFINNPKIIISISTLTQLCVLLLSKMTTTANMFVISNYVQWCNMFWIFLFCPLGNSLGTDMLTEHPLLSEPSSVSFYNWMSNAVGNRTGAGAQDSPVNRSQHNSLQTGQNEPAWGLASIIASFLLLFCSIELIFLLIWLNEESSPFI